VAVGTLLGPEGADPAESGARPPCGGGAPGAGGCVSRVRAVPVSYRPFAGGVSRLAGPSGGWGLAGWWGGGWWVVENCTVDASIFFTLRGPDPLGLGLWSVCSWVGLLVVVKLLRAHGGCLGTRSR
jgi:hypothetical protein